MERQLSNTRMGPLPGGDRRGTSGADAGRLSMQTVSGSLLNRRAGAGGPENSTADQRGGEGTDDALQSRGSPTDSVGSSVMTIDEIINDDGKKKWSTEELKELMFCYFKSKAVGPGYLKRLYETFKQRNPRNLKIQILDGSKLSNQARVILKGKILSKDVLAEIKHRAEQTVDTVSLNSAHSTTPTPHDSRTLTPITQSPITNSNSHTQDQSNNTQENEKIQEDSRRKWTVEEQHELMFCYFKAKAGGLGYIRRLYDNFCARNPHNPKVHRLDGNKLSNQVRTILNRKLISDEVLAQIKLKVQYAINRPSNEPHQIDNQSDLNTATHIPSTETQHEQTNTENQPSLPIVNTNQTEFNENQDSVIGEFLQALAETKVTEINDRKLLPKPNFTKSFIENMQILNKYLPNVLEFDNSLRHINDVIYSVAKTLIISNNQTPYTLNYKPKPKRHPPWKLRLQNKIEEFRKELGRLIEIKNGTNSRRLYKIKHKLFNKYSIFNNQDHDNTIEIIKQKIKALAARLKRYDDIDKRKYQNKIFQENQHKFYKTLTEGSNSANVLPTKDEIQNFWISILSKPISYNKDAEWITEIETTMNNIQETSLDVISLDKLKIALRKTHNWKSPGIDKVQNYYLKYLTSTHNYIADLFTRILNKTEAVENWFTTGQVILIPKNNETQDPKNWRPIACLPTMYKLLTSVIANELYTHCDNNNILAPEQRGCRRRARGCKDHLMMNKAILEDAHKSQKNLSMGWVDYRKAFDSVSHEWLLKVLDLYKCPNSIKGFLETTMPTWNVIMTARSANDSVTTIPIFIKRGIFQGDSLSPLLFCLAINPLTQILNKYKNKGYKIKDMAINHLLYMDDLKLYANSKNNLSILIDSTEIFTKDIGMSFGLDKCNILHMNAGRRTEHRGVGHALLSGEEFQYLRGDQSYKYLGIHESGKIEHSTVRQELQKEYFRRVKRITNSHLNSRNLIKAINSFAIPVLLYSFGVVNYKNTDLKNIDVKTRKFLNMNKAHHKKADLDRLYLTIETGGRGLINVEMLYKTQIIKYQQYLEQETDYIIKAITTHDKTKDKYSIDKEAKENRIELKISNNITCTDTEIKSARVKHTIDKWKAKPLHGQFYRSVLDRENIDTEYSFRWLKKQTISPSLEASVFSLQDQAIVTKQHERDVLKKPVDGKCRLCGVKDETVQHIVAGCEKLAGTYYIKRHNNVVQYVYWTLLKKHSMDTTSLWWKEELIQPQIKENDTAKIMWEMPVQTDVTVTHNRPDIIYTNKTDNKTYLIDVTIPSDYNIGAKEIEKLGKYHLLQKEITRLWKTQAQVIPIVIGVSGIVGKSIHKYCTQLDSKINIHIMQKQATIHTTTILSKVLGNTIYVERDLDRPLP